jgi:hypothetical protein
MICKLKVFTVSAVAYINHIQAVECLITSEATVPQTNALDAHNPCNFL